MTANTDVSENKNGRNGEYYEDSSYKDYQPKDSPILLRKAIMKHAMSKRESENWSLDRAEDYAVAITTKMFGSKITSSSKYDNMYLWKIDYVNSQLLNSGYEPITTDTAAAIKRMMWQESTLKLDLISIAADEELDSVSDRNEAEIQHILSVCARYQEKPRPNHWTNSVMKKFKKAKISTKKGLFFLIRNTGLNAKLRSFGCSKLHQPTLKFYISAPNICT